MMRLFEDKFVKFTKKSYICRNYEKENISNGW